MRGLAGLLVIVAVAGCGGTNLTSKDVELTIGIDPNFADGEIATVKTLDLAAIGAGTPKTQTITLTRPLTRTERIVVHFAVPSGMVQVSALARDGQAGVVLRGVSLTVDLADTGGPHPASLTLYEPVTGAHSPAGFALAPPAFSLFTGQTVALEAKDEKVIWASDDGASVDDTGLFTAPSTAGTFHAVATSTLYPTDKATATLNVLATGITRYAGGLGGTGTLDGTGKAARVNFGTGMLLDGSSLYFTEFSQTLRRADTSTGEVVTLAGTADRAQTLDGTGAAAGFVGPQAIATDGTTIYVAEDYCPCIRAVSKNGAVTTLAGKANMSGTMDGTGAGAQFVNPYGLAYDAPNHRLWVTDGSTIRTVDVTNGTVTTIAGVPYTAGSMDGPGATATFNFPNDIVLDGGGLYINDQGNSKIRRLDVASKMVSTVVSSIYTPSLTTAGSGKLALTNPIRVFDIASATPTTIFDDNKQPIYQFGNAILMQDDGSFWLGSIQTLYHFDAGTKKLTPFAGYDLQWAETVGTRASAQLGSFNSFAVRSDGVIFGRDNRIVRIELDGTVSLVTSSPTGQVVQGDGDMAFGSDGFLYAPDRNLHVIWRIDPDHAVPPTVWAGSKGMNGATDGPVASARFWGPGGITADGDVLYVTDRSNNTIRALNVKTGVVSTVAGMAGMCGYVDMPGAAARFCNPEGIAADGAGNLYVADNNSIRKIVIAGGAVSALAQNNGLGFVDGASGTAKMWGPSRLAVDAQKKYVYFSENGNDAIRRVEIATGIVSTVAGGPGKAQLIEGPLPGSVNQPGTLGFAKTGELLVAVPRESSLVQIRLP